uniref:Cysteine proteinase 1, mitochondrial n=1 Tax=Blastobotrys adeninivorans TaxID=409370 RepID=A0A060TEG4_BLAAD
MGSGQSKEVVHEAPVYREKVRTVPVQQVNSTGTEELTDRLAKYLNMEGVTVSGSANPVTPQNLGRWQNELLANPKNQFAQAAVSNNDISQLILKRDPFVADGVHVFSDKVNLEGSPVTNQRSSGRCWLFASTNVFRTYVMRKYNIDSLELSQAYLFFYDKLEKAHHFLQNAIDTADVPLDDRLVQALFNDPTSDGGQWDMVVNLVNKYGVVPQSLYPDSYHAKNSSRLNYVVVHKLREFALVLRKLASSSSTSAASISSVKEKFVREIHSILVLALGTPPSPTEQFTWEYYDKNGKFHSLTTTPVDFFNKSVGFNANEHFSLINDPRHSYKALYTVDKLGNVHNARPIEYVNATSEVLKQAAIKAIQNNEPVFFGSDVGKFSDSNTGVMDTEAWDYELAFDTKLGLNKAERLQVGDSAMTHAMVLTAVHLVDGRPVKWKVENSWGEGAGDKGYFIMTDKWFDEYVFQVVTSPKYVEKEYVDIYKSKEYHVLPLWDPLGALA